MWGIYYSIIANGPFYILNGRTLTRCSHSKGVQSCGEQRSLFLFHYNLQRLCLLALQSFKHHFNFKVGHQGQLILWTKIFVPRSMLFLLLFDEFTYYGNRLEQLLSWASFVLLKILVFYCVDSPFSFIVWWLRWMVVFYVFSSMQLTILFHF